jgi:hypothetical protein
MICILSYYYFSLGRKYRHVAPRPFFALQFEVLLMTNYYSFGWFLPFFLAIVEFGELGFKRNDMHDGVNSNLSVKVAISALRTRANSMQALNPYRTLKATNDPCQSG